MCSDTVCDQFKERCAWSPQRPDPISPLLDLNVDFYSVPSALKGLNLCWILLRRKISLFPPHRKGTPERLLLFFSHQNDIGRRARRTWGVNDGLLMDRGRALALDKATPPNVVSLNEYICVFFFSSDGAKLQTLVLYKQAYALSVCVCVFKYSASHVNLFSWCDSG